MRNTTPDHDISAPSQQNLLTRFRNSITFVMVMVLLITPLSASALWSDSRSLNIAELGAATVTPVGTLNCKNNSGVLGIGPYTIDVSWTAVTGASSYNIVMIEDGELVTLGQITGTSFHVYAGLLQGILGSLLELLRASAPADVYVQAVHQSGWVSALSPPISIKNVGLLPGLGLLGGVGCD